MKYLIFLALIAFGFYYVTNGQGIDGLTLVNLKSASVEICAFCAQILKFAAIHLKTLASFSIWQILVVAFVVLFVFKMARQTF